MMIYTSYIDVNYIRLLVDLTVKDKQKILDSYETVYRFL